MFLGDPKFQPTGKVSKSGLPIFISTAPCTFVSTFYNVRISIPIGVMTDGGTIPKGLRWWLHPHSKHFVLPFFLHDYICSYAGKCAVAKLTSTGENFFRDFTRSEADILLYEASICQDAPIYISMMVYAGASVGRFAFPEAWGAGFKKKNPA